MSIARRPYFMGRRNVEIYIPIIQDGLVNSQTNLSCLANSRQIHEAWPYLIQLETIGYCDLPEGTDSE